LDDRRRRTKERFEYVLRSAARGSLKKFDFRTCYFNKKTTYWLQKFELVLKIFVHLPEQVVEGEVMQKSVRGTLAPQYIAGRCPE
jgi:hypothetical protein